MNDILEELTCNGRPEISSLLVHAGRINDQKFRSPKEAHYARIEELVKRLKKEAGIRFWRHEVTKSLEEMAKLLEKVGIAGNFREGTELAPQLNRGRVMYGHLKELIFSEVQNSQGETCYRITDNYYGNDP